MYSFKIKNLLISRTESGTVADLFLKNKAFLAANTVIFFNSITAQDKIINRQINFDSSPHGRSPGTDSNYLKNIKMDPKKNINLSNIFKNPLKFYHRWIFFIWFLYIREAMWDHFMTWLEIWVKKKNINEFLHSIIQ